MKAWVQHFSLMVCSAVVDFLKWVLEDICQIWFLRQYAVFYLQVFRPIETQRVTCHATAKPIRHYLTEKSLNSSPFTHLVNKAGLRWRFYSELPGVLATSGKSRATRTRYLRSAYLFLFYFLGRCNKNKSKSVGSQVLGLSSWWILEKLLIYLVLLI